MSGSIQVVLGGSLELVLRQPPTGFALITRSYRGFAVTAKGDHMAYLLPSRMFVQAQIAYVDAGGNPATVDGDVVWASSDETVATVTADANDSTLCSITSVGPLGAAQISATADADLGAGVRQVITLTDVTVVAGEAVAGTITIQGDPQPT